MSLERGQVMQRIFAHPIGRVENDATIQLGGIFLRQWFDDTPRKRDQHHIGGV
jgi:hypothetical protein